MERLAHKPTEDELTQRAVRRIVADVERRGDRALVSAARRFDKVTLSPARMRVSEAVLEDAWNKLEPVLREALERAAARIRRFHERQVRGSWELEDDEGFRLEQRWGPVPSVGVYVPGGAAAYPSSVLMNVIPALVAGVPRIVAVTPPRRGGTCDQATMAALHMLGVTEVYQVGGAQAVAALALGTETIPKVDKVVGPGNKYVAEAKRLLFGRIDIDMIAGPSEVLIIADDSAPVEWIAADMVAQAEHDPDAQSIAVLVGRADARDLAAELRRQVARAPRRAILEQSLANQGLIIHNATMDDAREIIEIKAPEHLELLTRNAGELAAEVRNAGSIFVGRYAAEAIGDYVAGPNHVLPTGGTARFSSPLSVQDFLKMSQVIHCSADGLRNLGRTAVTLAVQEGLDGHAESVLVRLRELEEASQTPPRKGAGAAKKGSAKKASRKKARP